MLPEDPPLRAYLRELVTRLAATVGDLVGVYAGGSVALDGYLPGRSDLDVAVVCRSPLPIHVKQLLVAGLRHESLPCPARGLELVVYRWDVAAAGSVDPGFELELNSGAGITFHAALAPAERAAEDGTFWYAIDRSILREHGIALVGPPPAEVFGPLPEQHLVRLLTTAVRWHLQSTGELDTGLARPDDAVLNACRALRRAHEGVWSSKPAAGQWLLDTNPGEETGQVITQALAARSDGPPPPPQDVRRFQRAVLAALESTDPDSRVAGSDPWSILPRQDVTEQQQ